MKKKHLFIAATALLAFASCADDGFVGDENAKKSGEGAISFDLRKPGATRADKTGADAASDLSSQFIVYAEKDETADGNAPVTDGSTKHQLVFQNYKVAYTANTAYTTTSNTKNWEYVGQAWVAAEQSHITTSTTDAQTIKYWDWGADSYTFTAVSALPTDISNGYVSITKTTAATTGNKVYDKGYSVDLTANADLDKLFFSERKVITSTNNTDRDATNAYGGNVTLRFHNAATKVRVAMYENIPGHSVTINKFSVDNDGGATPAFSGMTDDVTANFAANFQNCAEGTAGTLTVKYYNTGTLENQPTVSFSGTAADVLALGTNLKNDVTIGTTITGATFDRTDGDSDGQADYTTVFPKENNTQNLKLKVSYTLTAPVTGETITVTDATAEVPAAYLQWKPGYAYTYIFKISDNTNGHTGSGSEPAGLYPITFDAIEMVDADGKAEYITTVSEPSITTFGVKDGKYSVGGNEYAAGTVVYATVEDASTLVTLSSSNMNLYTVTGTGNITEAGVAEYLIEKPTMTKAQVDLAKVVPAPSSFTDYTKTVPAEDGTTKDLDASDAKAAYFTTATSTKYAIVYQKTAATYVWGTGNKYADSDAFDAAVSALANDDALYTTDQCTVKATYADASTDYYTINAATYADGTAFANAGIVYSRTGSGTNESPYVYTIADAFTNSSTVYYKPSKVKDKGAYAVKVVNCPEVTP